MILFGLIGAFLNNTASSLDGDFLRARTLASVSYLFSLPISESVPIEGLPQTCFSMEKRGALVEYAELLADVCTTTGRELTQLKAKEIGNIIKSVVTTPNDAQSTLYSLSETISGFDDRVEVQFEGSKLVLPFFKNARRLLHNLPASLQSRDTATALTLAAPSVRTVSALIQLGILAAPVSVSVTPAVSGSAVDISPLSDASVAVDVAVALESRVLLSASLAEDVAIRCAAVVACHQIAEQLTLLSRSTMPEWEGLSISPYGVSLFLERVCDTAAAAAAATDGCRVLFIPHDINMKW